MGKSRKHTAELQKKMERVYQLEQEAARQNKAAPVQQVMATLQITRAVRPHGDCFTTDD